jgi:uncharacterized protein (DUF58 family)
MPAGPRPTRTGWLVALAAVALGTAGWVFGQPELAVLGAGTGAVAVAGALYVVAFPLRVEAGRSIRPARVAAGDPCRVAVRVRNSGRLRTPVLRLRDEVGTYGTASLQLAPIPPGVTREALYTFPTRRRGIHRAGPLTVEVEDPFGLVRVRHRRDRTDTVIVLPRLHRLSPLPAAPGEEPEPGLLALASNSTVDEEFAALRPYVPGDDVRRIHWRTTARLGHPVVRQFDEPWQHRSTIVLDVRAGQHDTDSFERAVSAAASVVALAASHGEYVRLVTTDGRDSGFVAAWDRADELLDQLAVVEPAARASLTATTARLSRGASGRLVVCVGALDAVEGTGLLRMTRAFGLAVVVATRPPVPAPGVGGPALVVFDEGDDLATAWLRGATALRADLTGVAR